MRKRSRPGADTVGNLIRKSPRVGSRAEPPQIVETQLWGTEPRKLGSRLPVEMAQQPKADPAVRNRAQLLLDALERHSQGRPPSQGLVEVERSGIEAHREQAGEPAHRPRQVDTGKNLLTTMTLKIEKHAGARVATALAAPFDDRQCQRGQQHLVDAAMECRPCSREQYF